MSNPSLPQDQAPASSEPPDWVVAGCLADADDAAVRELQSELLKAGSTPDEIKLRLKEWLAKYRRKLDEVCSRHDRITKAEQDIESDLRTAEMLPSVRLTREQLVLAHLELQSCELKRRAFTGKLRFLRICSMKAGRARREVEQNAALDAAGRKRLLMMLDSAISKPHAEADATRQRLTDCQRARIAIQHRIRYHIAAAAMRYRACFGERRPPPYQTLMNALGDGFKGIRWPETPVKDLLVQVERELKRPTGASKWPSAARVRRELDRRTGIGNAPARI